jgi:hypothetical protein
MKANAGHGWIQAGRDPCFPIFAPMSAFSAVAAYSAPMGYGESGICLTGLQANSQAKRCQDNVVPTAASSRRGNSRRSVGYAERLLF